MKPSSMLDPSQVEERNEPRSAPSSPSHPPLKQKEPLSRAWRWIHSLCDPESFLELDPSRQPHSDPRFPEKKAPPGDGVITGIGRVNGKPLVLYAQDPTVMGGALGIVQGQKIVRLLDLALRERFPVVGFVASGGARIHEGVLSLTAYGEIFRRTVALSGKVPQITVAMGTCAGGAVYQPALTDLVIMVKGKSRMFITGPRVVMAVTREEVSEEELGGWEVHAGSSGLCAFAVEEESEVYPLVRELLRFFDAERRYPWEPEPPERIALREVVPADPRKVYDVRDLILGIVDRGSFLEVYKDYARNLVTGWARIGGIPIGILANQPRVLGGVLDLKASRKGARFVRLCDSYGIPLVTFVDCPGYLPGRKLEREGIIVDGAKLLHAYCYARIPRFTVILRKAYGGAFIVLGSRSIGSDYAFAWEGAEIGVMGAKGAVEILYRKVLLECEDPEGKARELEERFSQEILDPREALRHGTIDAVIQPEETRSVLMNLLLTYRPSSSQSTILPL